MKQHAENFKTGAYAKSHEHKFQYMPPHKQLLANDLFKSLLDESTYDYETEEIELEIDVSDSDFAGPETDALVLDHPLPTQHEVRGKALWHAALDFITMESIREEQFRVAAEETHEGRELAIGERVEVVTVTDEGREIQDTAEHHLNVHLGRIQSNYKEHMKFGGVEYDAGSENDNDMGQREWVAVVEPDEEEMQPEAKSSDSSPMAELEVPEPEED